MVFGTKNVSALPPSSLFLLSSPHYAGFVNAQYRFVMNPTGDYTVHFADPDMHVSTFW